MPLVDASLRDAAVLVSCLDEEDAGGLLAVLGPAPARRIREALSALGTVSSLERERVMHTFLLARQAVEPSPLRGPSSNGAKVAGGVELDEGLARRLAQPDEPEISIDRISQKEMIEAPFAFLLETDAEVVASFLARESPQTVAVVLSYLRRSQAAELLTKLPTPLQTQVLRRLARLDDIDPASIDVVADELQAWIARQDIFRHPPARGDRVLRDMLANRQKNDRAEVIAELAREAKRGAARASSDERAMHTADAFDAQLRDTRLVEQGAQQASNRCSAVSQPPRSPVLVNDKDQLPQPRVLEFDDLVHLENDDLLGTLESVSRDVLLLALIGADERLTRRITQCVTRREAKQIRRSLRIEGPTRLDDIEAAKRHVARIASETIHKRTMAAS